jgi:hypothetical protein
VFATLQHTLNSAVGEFNQIGPAGDISFLTNYVEGGPLISGIWHVRPDNVVQQLLVRGVVAPAFGGGAAVRQSQTSVWLSGRRYPSWVRVSGGTFVDGIVVLVPPTVAPTPTGTNVSVQPVDPTTLGSPATVTFSNVSVAGETTVTTAAAGPILPSAFALGNPPLFYNITTTAVFAGPITVCVNFAGVTFPSGALIRLLHFEGGAWQDVTSSGPAGTIVCGTVTSLSPFVVAQSLNTPADNLLLNGDFSDGLRIPVTSSPMSCPASSSTTGCRRRRA